MENKTTRGRLSRSVKFIEQNSRVAIIPLLLKFLKTKPPSVHALGAASEFAGGYQAFHLKQIVIEKVSVLREAIGSNPGNNAGA